MFRLYPCCCQETIWKLLHEGTWILSFNFVLRKKRGGTGFVCLISRTSQSVRGSCGFSPEPIRKGNGSLCRQIFRWTRFFPRVSRLLELAPDCKRSLKEPSQCAGLPDVGGVSWGISAAVLLPKDQHFLPFYCQVWILVFVVWCPCGHLKYLRLEEKSANQSHCCSTNVKSFSLRSTGHETDSKK